jgi:hypothetical protein
MEKIGPSEREKFQKPGIFLCHSESGNKEDKNNDLAKEIAEIRYLSKVGKAYKNRFNHASHKHPSESNHTSHLRKNLMKN